jgi:putative oxidoreductase
VQRLFSVFPDSIPGVGLLLLRISLAFQIVVVVYERGMALHPLAQIVQQLLAMGIAGCLAVGFATPFAATLQAAVWLWAAYVHSDRTWAHISSAGVSASLATLGPGAWSIYARIFGRKRIDVPRR